jgi:sirohydrochlorin ferrochelatase
MICESLRARGRYTIVQPSYLELAEPSISEGGATCVAAGATEVILLPFFLSPGKHVVEDLAAARDDLASRFPAARFTLANALGNHPLILDALDDRARAAESHHS